MIGWWIRCTPQFLMMNKGQTDYAHAIIIRKPSRFNKNEDMHSLIKNINVGHVPLYKYTMHYMHGWMCIYIYQIKEVTTGRPVSTQKCERNVRETRDGDSTRSTRAFHGAEAASRKPAQCEHREWRRRRARSQSNSTSSSTKAIPLSIPLPLFYSPRREAITTS